MAKVHFIADAHLGHRAIGRYRDGVSNTSENTRFIIQAWNQLVSRKKGVKGDIVWCLGDMAFDETHSLLLKDLPGRKFFIGGNHDDIPSWVQTMVFEEVYGIRKKFGMWLTHCPMHPQELYNIPNVHGHVHEKTIPDTRYFNACVDALLLNFGKPMITLEEVRGFLDQGQLMKIGEPKNFAPKESADNGYLESLNPHQKP